MTSFPWKGISDLQELSYLGLYSNHIAGSFPLELTKLKELRFLSLGHNHFHGPIPSSITQLTELEDLNLEDNALSGRLPPGLSALQNLKELWLNDNRLSGYVGCELQIVVAQLFHRPYPCQFVRDCKCFIRLELSQQSSAS